MLGPSAAVSPVTPAGRFPGPAVVKAADLLAEAARTGVPTTPVRTLFAADDVDAAYAVQRLNVERRIADGGVVVGRKIGLTSKRVQRQLGVDRPDFGTLMADMAVPDGGRIPSGLLLAPKVEAEVALVLSRPLKHPGCTPDDVLGAVGFALPALEIVDSRIAGWDIGFVDTVADNASSGLFVLGSTPVPPAGTDLRAVAMEMTRNGSRVSTGSGAECLGGPLDAAAWLASTLARRGEGLRAGDVVLTGALGPMSPGAPGDVFEARITGLGPVRVAFAPEGDSP
ncbi:2-keto-4-pentenoate hydratase [Streptomyces sp. NPDC051018]|uniref:2-keto-4-pentenoate hydratase n=1 Tax=Streptomyces sp. NPDC051018 TaxID=3365639 RepID=UPI003798FBD9